MTMVVQILAIIFILCTYGRYINVQPNMESFASSVKEGFIEKGVETIVFASSNGPSVITEQWFGGSVYNENTIVRIYVDNEIHPSIEFLLLLGHGIGFNLSDSNNGPRWGNNHVGNVAHNGGFYNTYRIPYNINIKITIQVDSNNYYWYDVRGVKNYPVILGDLILPTNVKLKLYKNENVLLNPYEFLTVVNITNTSGVLFQITVQANSTNYHYLEGCFRLKINNSSYQFLSSGTEEMFLSAYYFNAGMYHDGISGCTYLDGKGKVSAYKFFEKDPMLFSETLELVWRCGEYLLSNNSTGCANTFPPKPNQNVHKYSDTFVPIPSATTITTYAWVYEYTFD